MAKITLEESVPSITITKEFLVNLFKCINSQYPRNIPMSTIITIKSIGETRTYEKLPDFLSTRYLPRDIKTIEFIKKPQKKLDEHKAINFLFRINTDEPQNSFYRLSSYSEGKAEVCKKEIRSLINQYKTWYWFLFKGKQDENSSSILGWLSFLVSISLSFLMYRILSSLKFTNLEINQIIAFFSFFVFLWLSKKASKNFPYLDLRVKKSNRSKFWHYVISTIVLGALGNLIWELLRKLVKI